MLPHVKEALDGRLLKHLHGHVKRATARPHKPDFINHDGIDEGDAEGRSAGSGAGGLLNNSAHGPGDG